MPLRRGPGRRPPPRRRGAPLATGLIVGGMMGRRSAAAAQQSGVEAAHEQDQRAQANKEAEEAAERAKEAELAASSSAAASAPVAYATATPTATATGAYAVAEPNQAAQGRQLMNRALSSGTAQDQSEDARYAAFIAELKSIKLTIQHASGLYGQAMKLNEKAGRSNMASVITRRGMERAMQLKRDKEMQAALAPAEKASTMLYDSFSKISPNLKKAYPVEMSHVGHVPKASLSVGRFGRDVLMGAAFGNVGDAMNQINHAKKVAQNKREIGACLAVCAEQARYVDAALAKIEGEKTAIAKHRQARPTRVVASQAPYALPASTSSSSAKPRLILTSDHAVDEHSPTMRKHKIISLRKDEIVVLLEGNLVDGLGGPYKDYVLVESAISGKRGRISRKIVQTYVPPSNNPFEDDVPPALF